MFLPDFLEAWPLRAAPEPRRHLQSVFVVAGAGGAGGAAWVWKHRSEMWAPTALPASNVFVPKWPGANQLIISSFLLYRMGIGNCVRSCHRPGARANPSLAVESLLISKT